VVAKKFKTASCHAVEISGRRLLILVRKNKPKDFVVTVRNNLDFLCEI
jgi:hypothetical protein